MSSSKKKKLLIHAIFYSLPQIAISLLLAPLGVLSGIYAKHYGLTLTSIAGALIIAKLFNAITDPIIGFLSDHYRTKTGSRKPIILFGGLLLIPCSYFLFLPPTPIGVGYFTVWFMSFYLASTLVVIPYMTWANEFTSDSREKTFVFSVTAITGQAGGALFFLLPLLPYFVGTEVTPEILRVAALFGGVLLLITLPLALKYVPNGPVLSVQPINNDSLKRTSAVVLQKVFSVLKSFKHNKPFLIFVASYIFIGTGTGMWSGLFFIYVDSFLKLGEVFAEIYFWGIGAGIIAVPIWYRLSLLLGKRSVLSFCLLVLVGVYVIINWLTPENTEFSDLLVLNIVMILVFAGMGIVLLPMLCDVVDYGRLNDREDHSGLYFSIYALMGKIQLALGGALGIAIIGWSGFDVNVAEQSELGMMGMRFGVSWLPAIVTFFGIICITFMPLNERRMEIIRRRLNSKLKRQEQVLKKHVDSNLESIDYQPQNCEVAR